jgi:GNAT superfamily N-acetyltransferase
LIDKRLGALLGGMDEIALRLFQAEDAPWLIERHGTLYAREAGFDGSFAPLVAEIIADYLARHDPAREAGWIAEAGGRPLGSIFCVAQSVEVAKLRLFLLEPEARGQGLGQRMLGHCMEFARAKGYARMTLATHESHRAACALYARNGWRIAEERPVRAYGCDLLEQTWEIALH